MTLDEVMQELEAMGSEQTKMTFLRHGAMEPVFGVRIGDMKKLVRVVKKDQNLAAALFNTGNYDAMYLAGLTVDPKTVTKPLLRQWVEQAYCYTLSEYTVANIAAESPHALKLAREWMASEDEHIAACGWSTYANYLSVTPDHQLDLDEIRSLLKQVQATIHGEKNRVRYTMNMFVICVGSFFVPLHEEAKQVSEQIGAVRVDVGQTACKVPMAADYIQKVAAAGKLGAKKKTCICQYTDKIVLACSTHKTGG